MGHPIAQAAQAPTLLTSALNILSVAPRGDPPTSTSPGQFLRRYTLPAGFLPLCPGPRLEVSPHMSLPQTPPGTCTLFSGPWLHVSACAFVQVCEPWEDRDGSTRHR